MTDRRDSGELADIVKRNIAALTRERRTAEANKAREVRVADGITRFAGSMRFVYLHAAVFSTWILMNVRLIPNLPPFDPFPFTLLATLACVEAIFLSTFVLISQNRASELAQSRAELDLQISLLAEHEITRVITLLDAIADHLGVPREKLQNLEELKRDVQPERVLREVESAERGIDGKTDGDR